MPTRIEPDMDLSFQIVVKLSALISKVSNVEEVNYIRNNMGSLLDIICDAHIKNIEQFNSLNKE
jgi:hypothetical protein